MLQVKVSMRGAGSFLNLSQFVGNDLNRFENCQFYINEDIKEADVWIVSEDLAQEIESCVVSPARVIFVSAETSWEPGFYAEDSPRFSFLKQFAAIYSCHDIYLPDVVSTPPFLPWMINANHGSTLFSPHSRDLNFFANLSAIPKTKEMSVFCSAQNLTPNHRMRLRFVEKLKEHFDERLDWFGNGINPLPEKWPGLAPYRYSIVLENQAANNIFTEKIFDAFLALTFPIYWGAPNLSQYFPSESFESINIRDLRGSIEIIDNLLQSATAEQRQASILLSKNIVLDRFNLFQRLGSIAEEAFLRTETSRPREIALSSWSDSDHSTTKGLKWRTAKMLTRTAHRLTR